MKTRIIATIILLGSLTVAGAAELPERAALTSELESALRAPGWDADRWSVLVVSLDRGDTLFSRHPEVERTPASNLKLFTTAAALEVLGPDYRYPTFLTADGPVEEGVVAGDLYVYGTGDPTLSARFFETKTAIWEALADSLAAAGIQRIAGDLVGDGSYFEGPGYGEGWQLSYVTHTYAAPAAALSYNDNIVTLRVTPGDRAGAPPNVQLIPGGSVDLRMEATTSRSGSSRIRVEREGYTSPIVVTGAIRQGATAQWRAVPVVDPARFAASVFREVLEERGIRVDGAVRSEYGRTKSPVTGQRVFAPATEEDRPIQVLAIHRSPPLLEILKVINQRSHNLYADAVLRSTGRVATGRGSVEGGEAAVAALLEQAGHPDAFVEMDDGSGLSTRDRTTARAIVALLSHMAESPHADAYFETLPEAATTRGLRRMQRTAAAGNLRAKTGTIDRVSALSGYVRAANGERLAFSILSNEVPSTWTAKRVEDRIGARLASFDRPSAPAAVAGAGARPGPEPGDGDRGPDPVTGAAGDAASDTGRATPETGAASTASSESTTRTYTIRSGDTMDAIARRNGITVRALREANQGIDPRRLIPGRTLTIPGGG